MPKDGSTPTLLVDVDGCLNCLQVDVDDLLRRGLLAHEAVADDGRPYLLHFDPRLSDWLDALGAAFDIVWCTTWRNANEAISPLLGLPNDLDQVWFPLEWIYVAPNLCRKTIHVRRWAQQRGVSRVAWIDDEATGADQSALTTVWRSDDHSDLPGSRWEEAFVSTRPVSDALVLPTDPHEGLTEGHVDALMAWAQELRITDL